MLRTERPAGTEVLADPFGSASHRARVPNITDRLELMSAPREGQSLLAWCQTSRHPCTSSQFGLVLLIYKCPNVE